MLNQAQIDARAREIATDDRCMRVAPAHVIIAAIEQGAGTPGRPLTRELGPIKFQGLTRPADHWQASIEAMLLVGRLYTSGGRFVVVES